MNKVFIIVFGLLTASAVMLSIRDVGVSKPSVDTPSIRSGSFTSVWVGGSSSRRK